MSVPHQPSANPLYAVIDLGSNSFHMLITRLVADGVQTVDKVKRKVRLASGLDDNNQLSQQAMLRGLECLSFFAERLQDIEPENICIVATATLRIATNAQQFLTQAEQVLGKKVTLLSGKQEAERIYLGVAHTSECSDKRLVLDIGGASTEIVVGEQFNIKHALSLDLGCVTFRQRFFANDSYSEQAFELATNYACEVISTNVAPFIKHGWHNVLGGSGTMQALAEILIERNQPAIITLAFIEEIKAQLIAAGTLNNLKIIGLQSDRIPVLASGLSILIALFNCFRIKSLQLSSGALREGLLYEMLPDMRAMNIRTRTLNSLSQRFHIDIAHANRVKHEALQLFDNAQQNWSLADSNIKQLLASACELHEVGLLLSYKEHQQHGAYILKHADLPGFDQTERQLLAVLVRLYKGDIDKELLSSLALIDNTVACQLLAILRLAIILCRRRQDDVLPNYQSQFFGHLITLSLPENWLNTHPLIVDELHQENHYLASIGLQLTIDHA